MSTFRLRNGVLSAEISAGQLTSFGTDSVDFMHKANQAGWSNSDTEMFPIIGPVSQFDYRLELPAGNAVQDQHGLLRELEYRVQFHSNTELILVKSYTAGTPVPNSKYPKRSPVPDLHWPYSFEFSKHFSLLDNELKIAFNVSGDKGMPFMLGYHPAFNLESPNARVVNFDETIPIEDILQVGDRALEVPACSQLLLRDIRELKISTSGFGHFMLWSPHSGMLCIEPITHYPYSGAELRAGFTILDDRPQEFLVSLQPQFDSDGMQNI